jgi:cellulose synthase/poly-beta-1,6-N-acetylglucosamine synthase-like glycosyltransferase
MEAYSHAWEATISKKSRTSIETLSSCSAMVMSSNCVKKSSQVFLSSFPILNQSAGHVMHTNASVLLAFSLKYLISSMLPSLLICLLSACCSCKSESRIYSETCKWFKNFRMFDESIALSRRLIIPSAAPFKRCFVFELSNSVI